MSLRELTEEQKAVLAPLRGATRERRNYAAAALEVRGKGDSLKAEFYGHASTTDQAYEMYGGADKGGWNEYIDAGAFKKTLSEKPDVAFLANHTGLTLARTKSGSLALSEDEIGLESVAQLDRRRGDVNDVILGVESGDLDEMSFAFRVVKQTWLDGEGEEVPWWDLSGVERHITEVSLHKGDVSVVNYGANPHTDATLRGLDAQAHIRAALLDVKPEDIVLHPDLVAASYEAARRARFIP